MGLLSAGVAIALQSLVLNLAGWAFIVWRRPFEVGDRIEIGAYKGDVVDIGAFGFTLLELGNWVNAEQSSGRTVRVPNGQIFSEAVANYTRGFDFIWAELPVVVTFESDWQKAKQVLTQIVEEQTAEVVQDAEQQLRQANEFMMVQYSRLSPTVYTRVVDSGRRPDAALHLPATQPARRGAGDMGGHPAAIRRVRRHRFRLSDASCVQQRLGGQAGYAGGAGKAGP